MGARHKSREAALAILYQADMLKEENAGRLLSEHFAANETEGAERDFVESLVLGATSHIDEIDAKLAAALVNWEVARLGFMDRAILRLGVYEILYDVTTPDPVAIDEAVELSKDYCDAESSALINATLDRISKEKA
ncbi:MAG: transcription antitermination factor NusB [Nitrospinae bacterium]|nr:transcription antitermination factor NusB [Nitrospinota bacterium]